MTPAKDSFWHDGFYRQDEKGAPCHGCADRAINIWSWNACGLSWDDLLLCTEALGRGYDWDILCLQEAQKNCSAEIIRQDGFLFVRGEGAARGAPTICLNKRLSQFFGEARFGKDFVALRLDVLPPVLVWTFHGPTAQFSEDEYVDALGDIVKAFHEMIGKIFRAMFALAELISIASWGSVVESPEGIAKVKDLVKLKELEKSMAFLPSEV